MAKPEAQPLVWLTSKDQLRAIGEVHGITIRKSWKKAKIWRAVLELPRPPRFSSWLVQDRVVAGLEPDIARVRIAVHRNRRLRPLPPEHAVRRLAAALRRLAVCNGDASRVT